MIIYKKGVRLYGARPEAIAIINTVSQVYANMGYDCIVTSITGKKHGTGSLHPPGFAIDFRTRNMATDAEKYALADECGNVLPFCDIVLEKIGEDQEHMHVEFDDHADAKYQADKDSYKETGVWPGGR